MTLNYQMIVKWHSKLNDVIGGSNPGHEIISLLDEKLAKWSSASCVLRIK